MNVLESKFNADMSNIYKTAKKELGYNATRFLQLISEKGGPQVAKILISKDDGTYGFEVLWERNRLDLSVENHVLKPEYRNMWIYLLMRKEEYVKKGSKSLVINL